MGKSKKESFLKRALKTVLLLVFLGIVSIIGFLYFVKWGVFGPLPTSEDLSNIRNATATEVYSSDDFLIAKIFSENRTNASLDELPQHLLDALVATEDARFYEHEGVDNRSMLRVLFRTILMNDASGGGGSTITQQLAKNLYGRPSFSFMSMPVNKVKEIILADRLERLYSKDQILEFYLNTVPFSENTYGIESASFRFFGKAPKDLKVEESAVLIGMLKANTYYNPRLHPDHATDRRNVVLRQMQRYEYLTSSEADQLIERPLKVNYNNVARDAKAPYYVKHIKKKAQTIVKELKKENGESYDIEQDGLKISTSLNLNMQKAAEKALYSHLTKLQKLFDKHWAGKPNAHKEVIEAELKKTSYYRLFSEKKISEDSLKMAIEKVHPVQLYKPLGSSVVQMSVRDSVAYYVNLLRAGFFAMNPQSGAVLAYVGGLHYRLMPYDHVMAKRQAASTFKPIVFASALSKGFDPCDYISNERMVYEKYDDWSPKNYDDNYEGYYSMKGTLSKSVNVTTVKTLFETGVNDVRNTARDLGIESKLTKDPSLALGTASISLYEMVQAYGVFANEGVKVEPYFIEKIEDAEGNIIYQNKPTKGERVLDEDVSVMITDMLVDVVDNGTARKLRTTYGLKNNLAGKTGTAQNYTDGWFIAYNPKLVVGVWVGASSPKVHFRSGAYGSGSVMALPIFAGFLKTVNLSSSLAKYSKAKFESLPDELKELMDCPNYRESNFFNDIKEGLKSKEGKKHKDEKDDDGWLKNLFKRKK